MQTMQKNWHRRKSSPAWETSDLQVQRQWPGGWLNAVACAHILKLSRWRLQLIFISSIYYLSSPPSPIQFQYQMADRFGGSPGAQFEGSPVRISGLSPEKYGSTALKNLSYTPEKLQDNFIYREVTVTKKIESEKNRIRELQSLNSLLEEKIRHLTNQNQTIKESLQLQVEMYKKMLREQEDKARSIINSLHSEYTLEIKKILSTHEEDSKVAQAQKEDLEQKIEALLAKIDELEGHVHHGRNSIGDLTSNLNLTSQKLLNTEQKLIKAEDVARLNIERLNREIDALNNRIHQQNANFKQNLDAFNTDKIREIEALKRLHLTELDKMQNKREAEMNAKNLQMKEIKNTFEAEARRLEDIINNKDRVNEGLSLELKKEKERVAALTRNYDLQINRLVNEKDHILSDLALVNEEKSIASKEAQELALLIEAERGRNAVVVNSLQGEIGKKNIELAAENQRLMRTVEQYEKELAIASHNVSAIHKTLDMERSEEVRKLLFEIRNLKQLLLQSSREMERCKEQFLRMELEREQLIRINHECEQEAIRLKTIISEQDIQLRMRRI